MKRTLILIANDGTADNPATGVNKDICDYRDFFTSDCGGAWYDSEIHQFANTGDYLLSKKILIDLIFNQRKKGSEYFLVVFCGHGGATESGDTIFELSPGNECLLSELIGMLNGVRFMLIADSCRSVEVLQEGGKIQTRGIFSHTEDTCEYRRLCRFFYDRIIKYSSADAYTICFSADFNETAIDGGRAKGGLFSQKLLDYVFQYQPTLEKYVVNKQKKCLVKHLSAYVKQVYSTIANVSGNRQHPTCYCKNEKDELPFVICPNLHLQDLDE